MGRVKIRCLKCGERRFQYTLKDEKKQTPHGAVCLSCGRQIDRDNLYQLSLVMRQPDKNDDS